MGNDPKTEKLKACSTAIAETAKDIIEEAQKEKSPKTREGTVNNVTFGGHGIFTKDVIEKYMDKDKAVEDGVER